MTTGDNDGQTDGGEHGGPKYEGPPPPLPAKKVLGIPPPTSHQGRGATHVDLGDGDVHHAAHHDEGVKGVPGIAEVMLGGRYINRGRALKQEPPHLV